MTDPEPSDSAASDDSTDQPVRVVGIGSSAGGLVALRTLIAHLPESGRNAYLIAQHLSPHYQSMLTELLARDGGNLKFQEITSGIIPEAQTVYITPPGHDLTLRDGVLMLTDSSHSIGPKPSVDHLFISLANEQGDNAVGIILSGTGSDGAHGIRAIKSHGGLTFAQIPETADYDGMPNAAIQSGNVDLVLSPEDIGRELGRLSGGAVLPVVLEQASDLGQILKLINARFGVNFEQYKESTIGRQLARRMSTLEIDSVSDYLEHIKQNEAESHHLFQSFLISVTAFYRDEEVWVALRELMEARISNAATDVPVRAWIAGCATGEEAYSLAIALIDIMDGLGVSRPIKVFATDIDERALEHARLGIYPELQVERLEESVRQKHFTREGRYYKVTKDLRDRVVFARHNLASDPPFFGLDLISCRNVFIYLKSELQAELLKIFKQALLPGGVLALGKAENITDNTRFRAHADVKGVYTAKRTDRELPVARSAYQLAPTFRSRVADQTPVLPSASDVARNKLVEQHAPMSVLLDRDFTCAHLFNGVEKLLKLHEGLPELGLFALLPSDMRAPVRALLNRAKRINADEQVFSMAIEQMIDPTMPASLRCSVVAIEDPVTGDTMQLLSFEPLDQVVARPIVENAMSGEDIQVVERELADTRENLHAIIEDMETANEELQALNEEMQASSEELQSSNEELHTTNEELQSTNEELQTVNQELQVRTSELAAINTYLENLQSAIDLPLVVVNSDLHVLRYTPPLTRLFQILMTDIGRPLGTLKAAVELNNLDSDIRRVMSDMSEYTEQFSDGKTQWLMRINPYFDGKHEVSGAVLTFTDTTELLAVRADLADRTAALESVTDGLILVDVVDETQPIVYASTTFLSLTGYSRSEVIGRNCKLLQGEDSDPLAVESMRQAIAQGKPATVEIVNYRKDGTQFWNQLRLAPVKDHDGEVTHYAGMQTDVSQRKQEELDTARRANYDALTGLHNRSMLMDGLDSALAQAARHDDSVYVLFIDLDGFKEINDTLGHATGDELLTEVASRLSAAVQDDGIVARFGGDEFVVLLREVSGLDVVIRIVQAILFGLRQPMSLQGSVEKITASIGVATYPVDGQSAEDLMQHADAAMYRAKAAGRDGFAFYQPVLNAEAIALASIKRAIFSGLDMNEFEIHYQPIMDVESLSIVGAEALLRWRHPERGLLRPDEFISIAEQTGQIVPLGNWVLQRAVRQLHNWEGVVDEDFRIALNLSAQQLHATDLPDVVKSLPADAVKRLDFEIAESVLMDKPERVLEALSKFSDRGVQICLDNFGSKLSSMRLLLDFPFDAVKIDRQLLHAVGSDSGSSALFESIFTVARGVAIDVFVEGIETAEHLAMVRKHACRRAQGFRFSEPLTPDSFETYYRTLGERRLEKSGASRDSAPCE